MFVKGRLCGPSLRRVGQGILDVIDRKRLNNWSITIQYNLEEQ